MKAKAVNLIAAVRTLLRSEYTVQMTSTRSVERSGLRPGGLGGRRSQASYRGYARLTGTTKGGKMLTNHSTPYRG